MRATDRRIVEVSREPMFGEARAARRRLEANVSVATNLSSFRPSPASDKEVAVILSRRTYGGQEESSQKGSSQEEGS